MAESLFCRKMNGQKIWSSSLCTILHGDESKGLLQFRFSVWIETFFFSFCFLECEHQQYKSMVIYCDSVMSLIKNKRENMFASVSRAWTKSAAASKCSFTTKEFYFRQWGVSGCKYIKFIVKDDMINLNKPLYQYHLWIPLWPFWSNGNGSDLYWIGPVFGMTWDVSNSWLLPSDTQK